MKSLLNENSSIIEFNKYEQIRQVALEIEEYNYESFGACEKSHGLAMEELYDYFISYNEFAFDIHDKLSQIPTSYQSQAETLIILLQRISWNDFSNRYFMAVLKEYIKQLNQKTDGILLSGIDKELVTSIIGSAPVEYCKK